MKSQAERFASDPHAVAQMQKTANSFQTLAALRGITSHITVENGQYHANGENCGVSVHGLYDWLNKQPGVKP